MVSYTLHYRVCYADTDKMGYMYYGNYARLYEIARVECLRQLGVVYADLEDKGIALPVIENQSRFLAPAKYDEVLRVECRIEQLPLAKICFDYDIFNPEGMKIHIGKTILVFMDSQRQKPLRLPQEVREVLEPYFKS